MEKNNILAEIKQNLDQMSAVERRIAKYMLLYPEKFINMSVGVLSSAINVSEGSIINFSCKMGFSGFKQLKIEVAKSIDPTSFFNDVDDSDSPKSVVKKMILNSVRSFNETYDALSGGVLQRVCEILMRSKRIEMYGVGSSSMVADDAAYRFMRTGLPCVAVTDAHIASVSALLLNEECAAFAISHSGKTIETLNAMRVAKDKKAKTICITSYPKSPLTDLCDETILVSAIEAKMFKEASMARLTQLLIIDSLANYIAVSQKQKSLDVMQDVIEIVDNHRVKANKPARREKVEKKV